MKRISAREFREFGFLQEINRQWLHPLGMALEVIVDEATGDVQFGGVWDYREDPAGLRFEEGQIDKDKAQRVADFAEKKHRDREGLIGFVIQPIEVEDEDASSGST